MCNVWASTSYNSKPVEVTTLPLTLVDLKIIPKQDTMNHDTEFVASKNSRESFILKQTEFEQAIGTDAENIDYLDHNVDYTITDLKNPSLYETTKKAILLDGQVKSEEFLVEYQPIDAAPWKAKEAYKLVSSDLDEIIDQYLLCYDNYFVEVTFYLELTEEQLDIAANKFANLNK
ncbi:hypothetical protein P261_00804 [Lachnospiraceae bacterium TWA4]|nr:hypothetical protein P261_00804 [Lachnospiraceae bacterium TWA4]